MAPAGNDPRGGRAVRREFLSRRAIDGGTVVFPTYGLGAEHLVTSYDLQRLLFSEAAGVL
jgi:hypothetical protein